MSRWLDVMLEEIRRKRWERDCDHAEHERRRGERRPRDNGDGRGKPAQPDPGRDRR